MNVGRRVALMGSTGLMALAVAAPAHAQAGDALGSFAMTSRIAGDSSDPFGIRVERVADATANGAAISGSGSAHVIRAPHADVRPAYVLPEPEVVIANPGTSTTSLDRGTSVNGVGQMVVDVGGGSIGLCTGTLINPRTVLFAAHCVNTRAATAYGSGSGGLPMSFGFEADNLPALQRWFNPTIGGQPNPLFRQSNPALALYNVNQVRYNPLSLEPAAVGFLYGDIATATLDTPAANVPTWALLFSALPPTTITAAGTGYNVQLQGYGSHGNATTGSAAGSDFRRRVAENVLGALTSYNVFETFLSGSSTSPTSLAYFLDFDDPRRGLTGASPFDRNFFRDNARITNNVPTEGKSAPGDSGGPLFLQNTFNRVLQIGVLSGSYQRFFNGQVVNGYGAVSFYQPIYLYWDWIAANNPYRYASAKEGDGLWTDPTRWVTTNDPNYFIIGPNGQLVNGVPNDLGEGKTGSKGQFGEICNQTPTRSECVNLATGQFRDENKPIGTSGEGTAPGEDGAASGNDAGTAKVTGWAEMAAPTADAEQGGATTQALPGATIANGLPGATNFVPNNADPVRLTGALGRYFDVSLTAAGTTTLDSSVTIDRFRITGAAARLNIASNGALTSLIDVTQAAGLMTVNGTLTSRGDFLLMGGGLLGNGRINAPFTTNIAATIAPGTETTIGTLTFAGNLVLSSGSSLMINTGFNGLSDRVAVVSTTFNAQNVPTNGLATLGGRVFLQPVASTRLRFGDVFTILTAQGGVRGTFDTANPLSAILRQEFIYGPNAVQVRVNAVPFASVVNQNSPIQRTFASLLDRNRAVGAFPGLFDALDLQDAATIQSTLEGLAPRSETLRGSVGIAAIDNNSRVIRDRMQGLKPGQLDGKLAYYGRRVQTAALSLSGIEGGNAVLADSSAEVGATENRLPENMSAFLAAGYLDGESLPMRTALPRGGRDQFDGFYITGGLEREMSDSAVLGAAFSYSNIEGTTSVGSQKAEGQLYQASVYGKQAFGALMVDTQFSLGQVDIDTERRADLPGQPITLRSNTNSMAFAAELGLGTMYGDQIRFGPRVAARISHLNFRPTNETGGVTALTIDRPDYDSIQGRAGFVMEGVGRIRPNVTAAYVHEFEDRATGFLSNFVGGVGGNVLFDLAGQDRNWFEVTGGVTMETGNLELSLAADTTLARRDVSNQSYRASVKFRF
jgi:uncharacterized protein YhjY with autotransporter beta-barrel domain